MEYDRKMDKKILKKIFKDYWDYNEENKKYRLTVEKIIKKYKLDIKSGELAKLLVANNYKNVIGKCEFCGNEIIKKSRGASGWDMRCDCGYEGWCKNCGKPYECFKSEDGLCNKCWVEAYNKGQEELEAKVFMEEPTDDEEIILNLFAYHNKKIFPNGTLDLAKISFIVKRSVRYAEQIFNSLVEKGYLEKRAKLKEDGGISFTVGDPVVAIKERKIAIENRVTPIVMSVPAQKVFHFLQSKFQYVFAEIPPSSFVNFNTVKDDLNDQWSKWFFTTRFDFVATDEDFLPVVVVEYNGGQHWAGYDNPDKRKFKRNICDMVGIPIIEINSYRQIETKLKAAFEESNEKS